MNLKLWVLKCFLMAECYMVWAGAQVKEESTIPIPTYSPPEGNTTFLDGTSWCVALAGAKQDDLQNALDWACGLGMADCSPIQPGEICFEPDNLVSHASYAFNNYYQQNGNAPIACNFGGTAGIISRDPSYGSCTYQSSGKSLSSSPPPLSRLCSVSWRYAGTFLLLYIIIFIRY
ncbi:glucan endo-1,3-beta-glucosidase 12 [Amborella trichopoda]|uniref:glucan endo-1,3-beta-glucosidase 12 n=1 Tax=Amborella trichopoda TaxID=13333 RepID=UPI0005D32509|nr:glucan endo-1,3-beta-glucosidase 12 [Amborella trichopoda]|eukprot:XP_011620762.1 glucan endo-1,3-beta-glucosidase 12 [Amborella trichopoda]